MKKLIKKILKEDRKQMFLDKIVKVMKNDYPLIKNMKLYGFWDQLSDEEKKYIFTIILNKNNDLKVDRIYESYYKVEIFVKFRDDTFNRLIYSENKDGHWEKYEHNDNGNTIYYENSDGFWWKREYRYKTNIVSYYEDSNGVIKGKRNI
jgi:hypothetical protein